MPRKKRVLEKTEAMEGSIVDMPIKEAAAKARLGKKAVARMERLIRGNEDGSNIPEGVENVELRRVGSKARGQRIVFVPEPKQKWHYELIALIPKLGHEFDVPKEFAMFPYAKYEWLRIMDIDPNHTIITSTKREGFYSYCLMVERLKRCMLEWSGVEIVKETKDTVTTDYLASEIDKLTQAINKACLNLGLYTERKNKGDDENGGSDVGEFEENENGNENGNESGSGSYREREGDDDLFD